MRKWVVEIERDGAKDVVLASAPDAAAAEACAVDHWLNGGGLDELLAEHVAVSVCRAAGAGRGLPRVVAHLAGAGPPAAAAAAVFEPEDPGA